MPIINGLAVDWWSILKQNGSGPENSALRTPCRAHRACNTLLHPLRLHRPCNDSLPRHPSDMILISPWAPAFPSFSGHSSAHQDADLRCAGLCHLQTNQTLRQCIAAGGQNTIDLWKKLSVGKGMQWINELLKSAMKRDRPSCRGGQHPSAEPHPTRPAAEIPTPPPAADVGPAALLY